MLEIEIDLDDQATLHAARTVFSLWYGLPLSWRPMRTAGSGVTITEPSTQKSVSFAGVGPDHKAVAQRTLAGLQELAQTQGLGSARLFDQCPQADWLTQGCLATIFHLISGAEEAACPARDQHQRFPASESSLSRLGLLAFPVADLLGEYCFDRARQLWPHLAEPADGFCVEPSHDVDAPFKHAFKSAAGHLRSVVGDVVRRGAGIQGIAKSTAEWVQVRRGHVAVDPYNCFDRIMSINEGAGLTSTFYFIAGRTGGRIDGDYDIEHPLMRSLIRAAASRGHRIGLHPSYHAPYRLEELKRERDRLHAVCEQEGYQGAIDHVRTHYLRFDPVVTPPLLQAAGFTQDSSLGFADAAGFRRGTCRDYPLWDCANHRALPLMERPLIAMDVSLLASRYSGHSHEEAGARLNALKAACRRFGGRFVLLWHNNSFGSEEDFQLYQRALV